MKKSLSLVLALLMLISSLSIAGTTVFAASKPKRVTVSSALITTDYFNKKCTFKATWKSLKGVTGYQIKLGIEGGDGGGPYFLETRTIKGAKRHSIKLTCDYYDAAEGQWHVVKIRAYKKKNGKKIYGKWSKNKWSKYKNINCVKNFKANVIIDDEGDKYIKLTWSKYSGAAGYQIAYYTSDYWDDVHKINNITGTSYTGWFDDVETILIRPYKYVNGKKKFGDYSPYCIYY